MKFNGSFLADVAKVARGGAAVAAALRQHRRSGPGCRGAAPVTDPVSREAFDRVAAMAAKARETQESLLRRITALEEKLALNQANHQ